ncbi:MAG: hypothetical protein ABEK16_06410 [Candidatus Nanohalobium sp.]
MALQAVTGIVYDITTHAWAAASVIIKYYLLVAAAQLYTQEGLTRENMTEKLLEESRLVLTGVVVTGAVLYILNFKPAPLAKLVSELIALGYLAFLFWKY